MDFFYRYCVGRMYRNSSQPSLGEIPVALVCFQVSRNNDVETSGILTLISVVFLLATFGIYSYLPQLRSDINNIQCEIC